MIWVVIILQVFLLAVLVLTAHSLGEMIRHISGQIAAVSQQVSEMRNPSHTEETLAKVRDIHRVLDAGRRRDDRF